MAAFVCELASGDRVEAAAALQVLGNETGPPYSFSRKQLLSKQADLGPSRFSALYHQQENLRVELCLNCRRGKAYALLRRP